MIGTPCTLDAIIWRLHEDCASRKERSIASNLWFHRRPRQEQAALRLLCLPYAGCTSYPLHSWRRYFPEDVELVGVSLPGRGARLEERAYRRMDPLVAALRHAATECLDRPFALFGHSMGAFIAFELCARLEQLGHRATHLIVSGCRAPHLEGECRNLHRLPADELLVALRKINQRISDALSDDAMATLYLSMLRADLELVESYPRRPRPPVSSPITAVGGTSDPTVTPDEIRQWSTYTTGRFSSHFVPGDHFFIHGEERAALQVVAGALSSA